MRDDGFGHWWCFTVASVIHVGDQYLLLSNLYNSRSTGELKFWCRYFL